MAAVLKGKLAVVTGASRGIGAAICRNLANKGCNLVMNYTSNSSKETTQRLADELQAKHSIRCHPVQADMGTETGPASLIHAAAQHFSSPEPAARGGFQIDILINNAGIGAKTAIADYTAAEFARVYGVNVRGPLLLLTAALPYLPHDRSGRVVNLSSVSASLGFADDAIYGGTKAALEAMTRSWARELAPRATVNAVNPGPVGTDMYAATSKEFQAGMAHWTKNTPLAEVRDDVDSKEFVENKELAGGRPGYDYEIAGVVAMLCTPDSGWCTGSVVCANGGMKFSY